VLRIAATGEIRVFRLPSQNAMRPEMHVIAAILFMKDPAIPRHQYRHGIRQQEHPSGHSACHPISSRVANARVLKIYRIHQVMQGDVRVAATQACKNRSEQAGKSNQWIPAKRTKQKVEPDHIRLQLPKRPEDSNCTPWIVKRPAPQNRKPIQFGLRGRNLIAQDRKAQEWITTQFSCNVKPILAQPALTRRKSGHQTNLHDFEGLIIGPFDEPHGKDVGYG
jgi:hypothetical protein